MAPARSTPRAPVAALLGALLVAACAGPSGPRRVPQSELPPDYRALLVAYDAGGEAWSAARAEALADPDKARFVVDNLSAHMVRAFETAAVGSHEARSFPFQRAQAELVLMAEYSLPLLVGMVATDDGVLAHLGVETCRRIGAPAIGPTLELFTHERYQVRRRAVELAGRLPRAGDDEVELIAALARVAREDSEWLVRAQAVRALGERAAHQTRIGALREALEAATADADSDVAAEAARALGRLGDRASVPTLIRVLERALADAELDLWNAAQAALLTLARGGPKRDVDGWRRWWREVRPQR